MIITEKMYLSKDFSLDNKVQSGTTCQLPTANCQLPTANCQLPTANCQHCNVISFKLFLYVLRIRLMYSFDSG